MFPNPQDALPLPPHPSLEQCRKLAKDLVKACRSDPPAVGEWADRWVESLARATGEISHPRARQAMDRAAAEIEEFATRHLAGNGGLAEAQFVIARSHGFLSWPKFVEHLDRLAHAGDAVAEFERAADALVAGDEVTLRRLLASHPELIHRRSTREHNATLLVYTAANGVEGYRQKTPKNILAIARLLLEAGADVNAEADVYGGGCNTLGLVSTSAWPRQAGVQNELMQVLLDHGASVEGPIAGNRHTAIMACYANGCPEAAEYLADHGAGLGLVEAAAVGRLDVVKSFFSGDGSTANDQALVQSAFVHACRRGRPEVARLLVAHGASATASAEGSETPIHAAAFGAHLEIVRLLLESKPDLEARNAYGGTVLTGTMWGAAHSRDPDAFIPVIETLIAAGAKVPERHPRVSERVDAVLARHGSIVEADWIWGGDEPPKPRKRRGS